MDLPAAILPLRGGALNSKKLHAWVGPGIATGSLRRKALPGEGCIAKEVASLLGNFWLLASPFAILLLEAFDPAGGVDKLHFPREERVTGGADFHRDRLAGTAGGELAATTTAHRGFEILRVNGLLHDSSDSLGKQLAAKKLQSF